MKKILLSISCFIVTLLSFGQAALVEKITRKGNELVIPYEKYTLPNGLTILLHEDHSDPVVHVDITYHVGSAREEIGKSGFAHFFEHMMFQGSDHVGDEQHFKIISGAGGTLNGSTNLDRTNYYETVPSNQLEKILWLESDRMGFLLDAVTQKKFEIQRSTVKNERGQNYDNRPYGLLGETSSKNLYPYGHPYSWLTIGYIEDLNRVDANDLKNFFLRWYGPNNATITIGGDINTATTLKWIEKYFGSIPRGPEVTKTILAPVNLSSNRYVSYTDNYARVPTMQKTFPTVPNYDKDMAALACLAQIIGQGKNSVLYQQLVKTQKAVSASAFSRLSELAGEFSIRVTPFAGYSLAQMDSLITGAFASFEKRGVTDDDIARFKGAIEAQYIYGLQSVSGKVGQLAAFQTFTGDANMIGKLINQYLAITKEDVWQMYEKYIKNKHSVTVSVLTQTGNTDAAKKDNYTIDTTGYIKPNYGYASLKYEKAKDNFDRSKMPLPGENPELKVPPVWRKTLPAGITVLGSVYDELPLVNLQIKIPGGHLVMIYDTTKLGLQGIVASILNEDTKKYTAEEMAMELQKLGSSISVSDNIDGITYNVQTLKKNLQATLALLEEKMLHPVFTEDAFNRIKKQTLESFKQRKSQPSSIASEVMDKLNFGKNNILGMNASGTEHTIKNITLEDVNGYYHKYFALPGTHVAVVGDIKEQEIIPMLAFLFKLPKDKIEIPAPGDAPAVTATKIYLIDVPKAAQTEFRIGKVTNLKYDATGEYYLTGLMNFTLGGDFNGRLNINLREDKGYTYGARSAFSSGKYNGDFVFSSGIRANATDSALTEILKEIDNYNKGGINPDELNFMKNSIGQRDARLYETPGQKVGFINRMLEFNLSEDFVSQQNSLLKNLSKAKVDALAKKWLDISKMNILLVGDKEKILPGLKKFGYEIIELDTNGNSK